MANGKGVLGCTKEELLVAFDNTTSMHGVILFLGFPPSKTNYDRLRTRSKELGVVIPATKRGKSIQDVYGILVENSTVSRFVLKKLIIKFEMLEEVCVECGTGTVWNGKPLVLQLDHINGIPNDNRIENLRFLCPNCHTQTPTWCGKKNEGIKQNVQQSMTREETKDECNCGNMKIVSSVNCQSCFLQETKADWPEIPELIEMIKNSNYVQVGKKLGVSDNAIRKRLKVRGYNYKTLQPFE